MKDRKKPAIRFKGFTEDWEQRKLNKISDKVTEKNIGLQYIETFTNSAEFGIISQRDFFDHEIANMSSLGGYYIVRSEDFVYNPRISATAPVGPINRNKLGRVGVMSPLYTVFRTYDVDTTYLEHFFKSRYWHSFMNFNGDSGARSDRFSIKDAIFFEMNIPIPHIEEQMKIGEYLTHINNLITLHQRKYDKLVNVKKSMLEKMFPKNGESIPDIRFSGFTEDWEQRKLGEVLRTLPFKPFLKIPDQDGKYEIIQQGNEPIIGYANGEPCEDFRNTVIFGDHTLSLYKPKQPFFVATDGVRILQGTNDMDGYYLLSLLEGNSPKSEGYKRYYSILVDREVLFTKNYYEQVKIGLYFKQLDNLITLHQRKLEKLKNIKKSCLEKMFI